ncbi:MAG TPA: methyltransferase, partial [Gemmatimonadaceae bacterium]
MSPSPTNYPPSFLREAARLRAFTPPFAFSAFFSPEDTLLCICATENALTRVKANHPRITELTTGSGLVGLHALMQEQRASLVGLDVDRSAIDVARSNASHLGVSARAMFMLADLWSESTLTILREYNPDLLICNPPYIPEPQHRKLEIEAGSGADGTAHLMRTLEIAAELKPQSLALSWCSVSDPERVLQGAARAGYALDSLYIVAIADGEYSRTVHDYLKA